MKECDNGKIHISSNFILSISLLIMFDTLLLRPSLHCNTPLTLHHTSPNYTSLHFAKLHHTSPHYTSVHFATLHPTTLHDMLLVGQELETRGRCETLGLQQDNLKHRESMYLLYDFYMEVKL
jgi:hypothetical protein